MKKMNTHMGLHWFLENQLKSEDEYKEMLSSTKKGGTFGTPQMAAPALAGMLLARCDKLLLQTKAINIRTDEAKKMLAQISGNANKNLVLVQKAKSILNLNFVKKHEGRCNDKTLADYADFYDLISYVFMPLGQSGGSEEYECSDGAGSTYSDTKPTEKCTPPHIERGFAKMSDFYTHYGETYNAFNSSRRNSIFKRKYFTLSCEIYRECLLRWIRDSKADYQEGALYDLIKTINKLLRGENPYNDKKHLELTTYLEREKELKLAVQKSYITPKSDKTFDINYGVVIAPALKVITEYLQVVQDLTDIEKTAAKQINEFAEQQKEQTRQVELNKAKNRSSSVFDNIDKD